MEGSMAFSDTRYLQTSFFSYGIMCVPLRTLGDGTIPTHAALALKQPSASALLTHTPPPATVCLIHCNPDTTNGISHTQHPLRLQSICPERSLWSLDC